MCFTGLNVNYTNAGTYTSYDDGTPVSIQMNLTFKELNPIYFEDYLDFEEGDNNGVGILLAYFRHLPDILYQSPLSHKNSTADYIAIKNIFRRTKLKRLSKRKR